MTLNPTHRRFSRAPIFGGFELKRFFTLCASLGVLAASTTLAPATTAFALPSDVCTDLQPGTPLLGNMSFQFRDRFGAPYGLQAPLLGPAADGSQKWNRPYTQVCEEVSLGGVAADGNHGGTVSGNIMSGGNCLLAMLIPASIPGGFHSVAAPMIGESIVFAQTGNYLEVDQLVPSNPNSPPCLGDSDAVASSIETEDS